MGICVSCRRRDRKAPEKRAAGAGSAAAARGPAKGAAAELLPRRADLAMANSISNIKMTNPIKGIVSKRRKRYIKDGFNLDLAYITDRLIAMGFPAEKLEGVYRNHIDEVYRFLEQMHQNHYKIYNLCSERSYDSSKFHDRVVRYAFEDHTPPNMELIQPFCEDVDKWLNEDPRNVAAVHCKAGKGRTGTMVCCYLLYSGQKATADEALKFYGTKRTHDEKGVTIPSQRRYVEYYEALVRSGLTYSASKLHVRELVMRPPPMLNGGQAHIELSVSQAQPPLKVAGCCAEARRSGTGPNAGMRLALDRCVLLAGDVRVDVFAKQKMMMRKEKLFHFWFNTFFVAHGVGAVRVPAPADSMNLETFKLTLNKWQLDDAHKDKQHKIYSPDFKVELIVQRPPESSTFSGQCARAVSPPSSSASSCSEPDTEPDSHWDSGERPDKPYQHPCEPYKQSTEHAQHAPIKPYQPECQPYKHSCKPSCEPYARSKSAITCVGSFTQCDRDSSCEPCRGNNTALPFNRSINCHGLLTCNSCKNSSCDSCRRNDTPTDPYVCSKPYYDSYHGPNDPYDCSKRCKGSLASSNSQNSSFEVCRGSLTSTEPAHLISTSCSQNSSSFESCPGNDSSRSSFDTHVPGSFDSYQRSSLDHNVDPDSIPFVKSEISEKCSCDCKTYDDHLYTSVNSYADGENMETTPYSPEVFPTEPTEYARLSDEPEFLPETKKDTKKNKKHSFFHRHDDCKEKGKIPKVSSDHTISDESKKKYTFFHKKDEDKNKPRLTLGDMRASWREFSGKWSENRKKKDRDES